MNRPRLVPPRRGRDDRRRGMRRATAARSPSWPIAWSLSGSRRGPGRERSGRRPEDSPRIRGAQRRRRRTPALSSRPGSNSSGSITRIAGSNSEETFGQRFMAWHEGLRAFTHHFLIGAGPGQFRSVTSSLVPALVREGRSGRGLHRRAQLLRRVPDDHRSRRGSLALVAWLLVVLGRARGPLVVAALVLLAIELAEPLNVAVTPVALGALGAAMRTQRVRAPDAASHRSRRHTAHAAVSRRRDPTRSRGLPGCAARRDRSMCARGPRRRRTVLRRRRTADCARRASSTSSRTNRRSRTRPTANDFLGAWPDPAGELSKTHFFLGLGDHPGQQRPVGCLGEGGRIA